MSNTCQKDEMCGRCCCTCAWHMEDFHHCTTNWTLREELDKCICSIHKGWICVPPEFGGAHSGWSEHGMCEMYTNQVKEITNETMVS